MQTSIRLADFLPKNTPVTLVPFQAAHLSVMKIGNDQRRTISKAISFERQMEMQANMGHAITAIVHGRPVACFGVVDIWEGVAEMWLLIEERGRKLPISLTKIAIAYRDYIVIAKNLHRLQITVKCSDKRAFGWAKLIGFTEECVMKRYDSNANDFYLMSRT